MKDMQMTLGEKIKSARLARKMTQSEVVGDYITRNMLSQIENNSATPSIKTLEYLSKVLDVSLSYFMSSLVDIPEESSSGPENADLIHLKSAKQFFKEKKYTKCIEELNKITDESNDEVLLLKAFSFLEKSSDQINKSNYEEAANYAERSISCNSQSLYYNIDLHIKALLFLMESNSNDTDIFEKYLNEYKSILKDNSPHNDFYLIYGIYFYNNNDTGGIRKLIQSFGNQELLFNANEFRVHFLSGLIEMNKKNFYMASEMFKKALKGCDNIRYKIKILIFLEQCCIKLEDYKSAYEYSNERLKYSGLNLAGEMVDDDSAS